MILSLSHFDYFSWISTNHCVRRDIMGNNRAGTNNCAISDFHPPKMMTRLPIHTSSPIMIGYISEKPWSIIGISVRLI